MKRLIAMANKCRQNEMAKFCEQLKEQDSAAKMKRLIEMQSDPAVAQEFAHGNTTTHNTGFAPGGDFGILSDNLIYLNMVLQMEICGDNAARTQSLNRYKPLFKRIHEHNSIKHNKIERRYFRLSLSFHKKQ